MDLDLDSHIFTRTSLYDPGYDPRSGVCICGCSNCFVDAPPVNGGCPIHCYECFCIDCIIWVCKGCSSCPACPVFPCAC